MKKSTLNMITGSALGLALLCGPRAGAQVLAPTCGGEGQSACQFWTPELWANDSGACDRGLKNSTDDVDFFFGKSGTCVVDPARRETVLPCAISSEGNYKCDVTLRPSAVGDYVFLVKARSKAGNSDVATATLTVK